MTLDVKALVSELDQKVQEVLPQHVDAQVAKATAQASRAGSGLNLDNLGNVVAEVQAGAQQFCPLCLSMRKTVNDLISKFGWLMPGPSAKVKTFLTLFFDKIYPIFCGAVPPA